MSKASETSCISLLPQGKSPLERGVGMAVRRQGCVFTHVAVIILLVVCSCLLPVISNAQTDADSKQVIDTAFPKDLDRAKVDSFYAKFQLDLSKAVNPELYYEVYRWYKTCYRYSGSTNKGIDCSGFSQMLYKKIYGKDVPHGSYSIYPLCKPIKDKDKLQEGDFVFFAIRRKGQVSHVGIYLQNGMFAHASTQAGVIISKLSEAYYTRHWYRGGRLKE